MGSTQSTWGALETHLKDVLDAIQRSGKLTIKAKRGSSKLLPVRVKPGYEPTTCNNIASKTHRDVCNKGRRSGKISLSRPGQAKREKFVGDWGVMMGKLRNTEQGEHGEGALVEVREGRGQGCGETVWVRGADRDVAAA